MLLTSKSVSDTSLVAKTIVENLGTNTVVAFYGEMGAGKTTIIQEVAKLLGISGRVLSPTFILLRRHVRPDNTFLFHADMYRLNDTREATALGLEEIWKDSQNLLMIEWPEKITEILPTPRLEVKIKKISANEREIEIIQV